MTSVSMTEGDHIITWSLSGHDTLEAVINISPVGVITCKSVSGGLCSQQAPGIVISGNAITAILRQAAQTPTPSPAGDICRWVSGKGGWRSITAYNIIELVQAYASQVNLGFPVTTALIIGAVAYYGEAHAGGTPESGNSLTLCNFT